jgi:hypothetical protein
MRYQGRIAGMLASVAVVACSAISNGDKPTIAAPHVDCDLIGPVVRPSPAILHPGDTLRLQVDPPKCGIVGVARFRWRSSDMTVGTVDSASGLVHAGSPGVATIKAMLVADSTVSGAAVLQVVP